MKKCLSVVLAAVLSVGILAGCVRQDLVPAQQNAASGQSGTGQSAAPISRAVNPAAPANPSDAYKKLAAFKTENYLQQSIADFNTTLAPTPDKLSELLAAVAEVNVSNISPDDENYDFITTTITISANELYCEHRGEQVVFIAPIVKSSRPSPYPDEDGDVWYEFWCSATLCVDYDIKSPGQLSVGERDTTLLTFKEKMQNYLEGLSESEIKGGDIRAMLTEKAAETAKSLSTDKMALSCEIFLLEGSNLEPEQAADNSFCEEEYQKLAALQLDGYEDMTISEYRSRIGKLTDSAEYRDLLERFWKSQTLYEKRDTDETASYLFYVLPLAGEGWKTQNYSGEGVSSYQEGNTRLEYNFSLTILDTDALTIREYNDMRVNVIKAMQDIAFKGDDIQRGIGNLIKQLQTGKIGISIDYAYFQDFAQEADKENTQVAEFNGSLLAWANTDRERMERIDEDIKWDDFSVNLTAEERSFIKVTAFLSGMENGKQIQSIYTGTEQASPYFGEYLPEKITNGSRDKARCSLYYQFSYNISDTETVTIGERDRQIEGMINAVRTFWSGTDTEKLLKMDENNIVKELKKIAAAHTIENIAIAINEEQVHFERLDERNIS